MSYYVLVQKIMNFSLQDIVTRDDGVVEVLDLGFCSCMSTH